MLSITKYFETTLKPAISDKINIFTNFTQSARFGRLRQVINLDGRIGKAYTF